MSKRNQSSSFQKRSLILYADSIIVAYSMYVIMEITRDCGHKQTLGADIRGTGKSLHCLLPALLQAQVSVSDPF